MDEVALIKLALSIRKKAYAPYSGFHVGAALLTKTGKVYSGCNIENASYGATCCAERVAIFSAVSKGEKEFTVIAIASDSEEYTLPCGICRQVMAEFKIPLIIAANKDERYKKFNLEELIPHAFSLKI